MTFFFRKSHSIIFFYIWAMPKNTDFVRFFKPIILCSFFGTLILPEFLSNQHGIWTPYPQSGVCYDFSKSPSMCYRDYPGFFGSLYSWMPKGSFCLLVKWADTAICCYSNANSSQAHLSSEQILPFGLHDSRPIIGSNVVSIVYMSVILHSLPGGWTGYPYFQIDSTL